MLFGAYYSALKDGVNIALFVVLALIPLP